MRQIKDIIDQHDTYPSWVPAFAAESGYVSSNDTRTRGMKTAERLALLPASVAPSGSMSANTALKESRAYTYDRSGNLMTLNSYGSSGTVTQSLSYSNGQRRDSWTSSSTTDNSEKRYRFGGKEIADTTLTELSGALFHEGQRKMIQLCVFFKPQAQPQTHRME